MTPADLQQVVTLSPVIKNKWKTLLQGEPVLSPLGRPDTLVCLMDATLMQLFAGFKITPDEKWLMACAPLVAPLYGYCACGLDPLVRYFAAGESAMYAAAGSLAAGVRGKLVARFRILAQQEIDAVCNACPHRDAPGHCQLAEKKRQALGPRD
jgi:hypothetical protein